MRPEPPRCTSFCAGVGAEGGVVVFVSKTLSSKWMGRITRIYKVIIICVWKYRRNVAEPKQKAAVLGNILPIGQGCASGSQS